MEAGLLFGRRVGCLGAGRVVWGCSSEWGVAGGWFLRFVDVHCKPVGLREPYDNFGVLGPFARDPDQRPQTFADSVGSRPTKAKWVCLFRVPFGVGSLEAKTKPPIWGFPFGGCPLWVRANPRRERRLVAAPQ